NANVGFGWRITSTTPLQIVLDTGINHSGTHSLRLTFNVKSKLDAIPVSQVVPINPSTQYELEFYERTNNLQGASLPFVQILDATDGSLIASAPSESNSDSEWKRLAVSFKTGEKAEAVIIRLAREQCGEESMCPIFGNVWYDDFSIKQP